LLQLESEHYSSIRPRRTAARGKSALAALAGGGVEYVEARSLDINPFLPVGIDAEQMRFMDAFLLVCLLTPSPDAPDEEVNVSRRNLQRVANEGRKPGLMLERGGALVSLQAWATELLDQAARFAALLDKAHQSTLYADSVAVQRNKVVDSALTPSARVLRELQPGNQTWRQFVMAQSISHSRYFKSRPYSAELMHSASELAERSLSEQAEMERQDDVSFEAYLVQYYKQYSML
jgi:glutamate--cysteine ligase